ncbi:MAG: TlpA family protein disulfide reductase [Flavobacteriales bacterium]|jgi:peroxiredoxin|nr:TlpA family protein disulfide reductase [Flavobacteriales bacterium]
MMNRMFRHPLLPLLALTLAACSGGGGGRSIDLAIEGGGGRTVFFDRFENNRPVHLDSVLLSADGKGTLKVPALPLDFYRIALDDRDALIVALDSAETLSVEAKAGELARPSVLDGSKHTQDLHAFYREATLHEQRIDSLRRRMAQGAGDSTTVSALNEVNEAYYTLCKDAINGHPGSPLQLSAVSKLNIQQDIDTYKLVRDQLRGTMGRSGFFTAFRDQVDRMEKQAQAMKQQEAEMQRLSNLIPVGGMAPEIAQQTPDGRTVRLSDLRGKVVLIDFWASWCKPCRMENPNVKKVYDRFHGKGFEILGVSLDRTKEAWVAAIQQDGLPWKHVSDLGFWNNAAAQEYGVSSIPFTVLVDRDGKVIDKNLRGAMLERRLAELFGS